LSAGSMAYLSAGIVADLSAGILAEIPSSATQKRGRFEKSIFNIDELVKSRKTRHSREGGNL